MIRSISFRTGATTVPLEMDEAGRGRSIVLLPALSSISTRNEMSPLLAQLSRSFRVRSVDWPGFGDLAKPKADWGPDLLSDFLAWFLGSLDGGPHVVVAAGHAATYALHHQFHHPGAICSLAMIAPTWRGPLPTMMGGRRPWFGNIRSAVDAPVAGTLLYALNMSGPVVRRMARAHVYEQPGEAFEIRLAAKRNVTSARGARFASVRFVTGALDRVDDRDAFLDLARTAGIPLLNLFGDGTPPKSRAEMEALAALPFVETVRLPHGKLALHEEYPEEIASELNGWIAGKP
ncbi:alpha/beta hydrolase [Rhodopseudomonas boonkerdii]|uniref:alpha/beta fold hydrolase n=1 Tax=Rhodopseudomonas boonkerdii TaxID=475937 RepID=UPI001E494B25|nr:alpha/beta hydrolase [Rhodopseudomonas boonkerdii]UGV26956.1 alpha/beta hydrolase [Rhodopseudomonas boonkerdii]